MLILYNYLLKKSYFIYIDDASYKNDNKVWEQMIKEVDKNGDGEVI